MPTLPKWIANTTEKLFSKYIHEVKVTQIDIIDENIKKVRFEGDFKDVKYKAGNPIEFRINDTDFRHYTPSSFDKEEGICDVIF